MFIHLRTHSDYSLLKSSIKIEQLVELCLQNYMPAVALTDINNLFGALEFAEYAASKGVQPIIGCSLEIAINDDIYGNILLLIKNKAGYINLVNILSDFFKSNAAHIDINELFSYHEGLIILTGGNDGLLSRLLTYDKNNLALDKLLHIFKDNIYVEIQRHNLPYAHEQLLIDFAYQYDVPLVATNDVFFAKKNDFEAHDALLCISEGSYIAQEDRMRLTPEHYFKSSTEMEELFSDIPEAINNTILIAKRCLFMPQTSKPMLPHFPCSGDKTEAEELEFQSKIGLEQRLKEQNIVDCEMIKKYQERLQYELGIIISTNYSGYFLIVSDFIKWSKANNIPVGPGRGSGVGSLVAWSLQITELDPIRFGLIFERFLNPERISMPDFDIDFCQDKRERVIEYVKNKYGYVAQIITFGKLQARAVLRDVGRVMQLPYSQVDQICKVIPHNPVNPVTLAEAIKMDKNLQKEKAQNKTVEKLLEISLKLEGLYRHVSTHAAGIVICDRKLEEIIPIYYDESSSLPITQYNMKYVEKSGLVKFDFLGLKTLTMIDKICDLIRKSGIEIDINKISLDDKKTYESLSSGDSIGVFQLESSGMREVIVKLKPDNIDDIIALISLYRPGPMENIQDYINRKHGLEKPDYIHPMLESVLKDTFGVIIYQEQVMEIARILANYSLGRADILRRAMGKKIRAEMDKQREDFINGAIKNNINKEKASYIFDLVAKFAGYGFNKSHAAAYALISFQTAYLKANYPLEFFTASMNIDINDKDKLNIFCQEARDHNIDILLPDINRSDVYFSIEGKAIRYGLGALKNVGLSTAQEIVDNRTDGYTDIWNFINRVSSKSINKRALESIIKSGAFDLLHSNRRQLFESIEMLLSASNNSANSKISLQVDLFANTPIVRKSLANVDEWDEDEKLKEEFFSIGFYLNNHPLKKYETLLSKIKVGFINGIDYKKYNKFAGIIVSARMRSSARGRYAIITLSSPYGIVEIAFYDSVVIENNANLFVSGNSVIVDLGIVDNINRLSGKNIYDFEEKFVNLINECIIELCNGDNINKLSALLNNKGKTKVFIVVLVNNQKIRILLPDQYCITPTLMCEITKLQQVIDVTLQ